MEEKIDYKLAAAQRQASVRRRWRTGTDAREDTECRIGGRDGCLSQRRRP